MYYLFTIFPGLNHNSLECIKPCIVSTKSHDYHLIVGWVTVAIASWKNKRSFLFKIINEALHIKLNYDKGGNTKGCYPNEATIYFYSQKYNY